jgi:hypothetical protein
VSVFTLAVIIRWYEGSAHAGKPNPFVELSAPRPC